MVHTAKEWGMKPSVFFACSDEDKAYMMEHESSMALMQEWEEHVEEKKYRKQQNSDWMI